MSAESQKCPNQEYLWGLGGAVDERNGEKWEAYEYLTGEDPENSSHPRHQEFMSDQGAYDEIGNLRRSCPKFVLWATIEPGRITPDLSTSPCRVASVDDCPIKREVGVLRERYAGITLTPDPED